MNELTALAEEIARLHEKALADCDFGSSRSRDRVMQHHAPNISRLLKLVGEWQEAIREGNQADAVGFATPEAATNNAIRFAEAESDLLAFKLERTDG